MLRHAQRSGSMFGQLRMTVSEICDGLRGRHRERLDAGTGLCRDSARSSLAYLADLGVIEVSRDEHDRARVQHWIGLNPGIDDSGAAREDAGWSASAMDTWWPVPADWIDLGRHLQSDAGYLAVLYFMRHAWGWNKNGATVRDIELSVDELARGRHARRNDGRPHLNAAGTAYKRVDQGLGYDEGNIAEGCDEAVRLGLLVRCKRVDPYSGREETVYLLRRVGWDAGELAQLPAHTSSNYEAAAAAGKAADLRIRELRRQVAADKAAARARDLTEREDRRLEGEARRLANQVCQLTGEVRQRTGTVFSDKPALVTAEQTATPTAPALASPTGQADAVAVDLLRLYDFPLKRARQLITEYAQHTGLNTEGVREQICKWIDIAEGANLEKSTGRAGLIHNRLRDAEIAPDAAWQNGVGHAMLIWRMSAAPEVIEMTDPAASHHAYLLERMLELQQAKAEREAAEVEQQRLARAAYVAELEQTRQARESARAAEQAAEAQKQKLFEDRQEAERLVLSAELVVGDLHLSHKFLCAWRDAIRHRYCAERLMIWAASGREIELVFAAGDDPTDDALALANARTWFGTVEKNLGVTIRVREDAAWTSALEAVRVKLKPVLDSAWSRLFAQLQRAGRRPERKTELDFDDIVPLKWSPNEVHLRKFCVAIEDRDDFVAAFGGALREVLGWRAKVELV